jgi:hypothetical protein
MLHASVSSFISIVFVLVGGATVWLMFHAAARMKERGASSCLVQAHRAGGYLVIALFSVMTYYMVLRLTDMPDELSARPMIHLIRAVVMMPLLFCKVLIARYSDP